jgi:hypothetical protein
MQCDSCGTVFDPAAQPLSCPHMPSMNGLAPGVVGKEASNDMNVVMLAQEKLRARIRRSFAVLPDGVRDTPVMIWHERGVLYSPDGNLAGLGFKVCVSVPPDAPLQVRGIVENLPELIEGVQIWLEPWNEAPGRERN